MTTDQVRAKMATLGIRNAKELARLFDVTPRCARGWLREETGRSSVPRSVGLCLQAWFDLHAAGLRWSPNAACKFAQRGACCMTWCGDETCRTP